MMDSAIFPGVFDDLCSDALEAVFISECLGMDMHSTPLIPREGVATQEHGLRKSGTAFCDMVST